MSQRRYKNRSKFIPTQRPIFSQMGLPPPQSYSDDKSLMSMGRVINTEITDAEFIPRPGRSKYRSNWCKDEPQFSQPQEQAVTNLNGADHQYHTSTTDMADTHSQNTSRSRGHRTERHDYEADSHNYSASSSMSPRNGCYGREPSSNSMRRSEDRFVYSDKCSVHPHRLSGRSRSRSPLHRMESRSPLHCMERCSASIDRDLFTDGRQCSRDKYDAPPNTSNRNRPGLLPTPPPVNLVQCDENPSVVLPLPPVNMDRWHPRFGTNPFTAKETDKEVLMRRQKNLDFFKCMPVYSRYQQVIPKDRRAIRDPWTPDKFEITSRRSWDNGVKAWKLRVYRLMEKLEPEVMYPDRKKINGSRCPSLLSLDD